MHSLGVKGPPLFQKYVFEISLARTSDAVCHYAAFEVCIFVIEIFKSQIVGRARINFVGLVRRFPMIIESRQSASIQLRMSHSKLEVPKLTRSQFRSHAEPHRVHYDRCSCTRVELCAELGAPSVRCFSGRFRLLRWSFVFCRRPDDVLRMQSILLRWVRASRLEGLSPLRPVFSGASSLFDSCSRPRPTNERLKKKKK